MQTLWEKRYLSRPRSLIGSLWTKLLVMYIFPIWYTKRHLNYTYEIHISILCSLVHRLHQIIKLIIRTFKHCKLSLKLTIWLIYSLHDFIICTRHEFLIVLKRKNLFALSSIGRNRWNNWSTWHWHWQNFGRHYNSTKFERMKNECIRNKQTYIFIDRHHKVRVKTGYLEQSK